MMKRMSVALAAGLFVLIGAGAMTAEAKAPKPKTPAVDAETLALGQRAFAQCSGCHQIAAGGQDMVGPNLFGVYGKAAGTNSATFAYSAALKAYGVVWNDDTLSTFLKGPSQAVPGTKMPYRGLSDDKTRAALVTYIRVTSAGK